MLTNDELVHRLDALRTTAIDQWSTRDRILYESARLIALKGYHGASTRDIAAAVGIRQPSMFNHFASKQEILAELMRYEVSIPAEHLRKIAAQPDEPPIRLCRYIVWEFEWYASMPFDLRGMTEELLDEPGLEAARADLDRWKRSMSDLVSKGIGSGDFHDGTAAVMPNVIMALSWEIFRVSRQPGHQDELRELRRHSVAFVLRGLLSDPSRFTAVLEAAERSAHLTVGGS